MARQRIIQRDELFEKSLTNPFLKLNDVVQLYVFVINQGICFSFKISKFRLLLPIELEKARLTYLLRNARRHFTVTRRGSTDFVAEAVTPLNRDDLKYLGATVGEKIELIYQGRKEKLFVSKLTSTGLLLTYPNERDFTRNAGGEIGPLETSFLHDPRNLYCEGQFHLAPFTFKILETSVIDGLTALGPALFGENEVRLTGLPLVSNFIIYVLLYNT